MSEQALPEHGFLEIVRAAVRASREPPRQISTTRLVVGIYRGSIGLLLFVLVGAAIAAWIYTLPGSDLVRWLLLVAFAGGILYLLAIPALEARDVGRATRDGLAATATVSRSSRSEGTTGKSRATIRWVVHHPTFGDYSEQIAIRSAWARDITDDSTVSVLVSPTERRTLLAIGVET